MAATPDGNGYWLVSPQGGVFAHGDAGFFGSLPGLGVTVGDIVGLAPTPDGQGTGWWAGRRGLRLRRREYLGSMGSRPLNRPIVAMAATPDGNGYWLVASDGGIFAFGDAAFYGSMGGHPLNQPIVAMAATPDGRGYWQVATDGGIFAFGDAAFYGSLGAHPLNQPIVAMTSAPTAGLLAGGGRRRGVQLRRRPLRRLDRRPGPPAAGRRVGRHTGRPAVLDRRRRRDSRAVLALSEQCRRSGGTVPGCGRVAVRGNPVAS